MRWNAAVGSAILVLLATTLSGCLVTNSGNESGCECYEYTQCETYCDATSCWEECFDQRECPNDCSQGSANECTHDGACAQGRICIRGDEGRRCRPDPGQRNGRGGICQSCESALDCADNSARCVALGQSAADGKICSPTCRAHANCPDGFECVKRDSDPGQCLPEPNGDGTRSCSGAPNLECTSAADCSDGEVCGENTCQPPEDAECSVDADCGSSEVCRDFECRPGDTECLSRTDCRSDEICKDGSCVSRTPDDQCIRSDECDGDARCVDGRCLTTCEDRDGCNPREYCRLGLCQPIECRRNTDCSAGNVCVEAQCRDACSADSDCDSGYVCNPNGFCERDESIECRSDAECARDETCMSGECRTPCRCSQDCSGDRVCDDATNVCASPDDTDNTAQCEE